DTLRLTPVFGIRNKGKLGPLGMMKGRKCVVDKFTKFVLREIKPDTTYRLAVGHTNSEAAGRQLYETLCEAIPSLDLHYFCRVGSALGAHTGGDSLVVALQARD
ncbi:MAG: DegV family protein, partial [Pseudomonadota bacterium]